MRHLVYLNTIYRYIPMYYIYTYIILHSNIIIISSYQNPRYCYVFFSLFINVANSGQDCEKELGLRQEIAVGVEIVGGTGRSVSDSDRQDCVHQ